jgi:hypothetical protein
MNQRGYVELEVLIEVPRMGTTICYVTPYSLVKDHRYFGGIHCLHLLGLKYTKLYSVQLVGCFYSLFA